ncbi:hypothetical protein WMF45_28825 [Sorangium sp. So ce448]|uniref:hypothetical protein n=1 Tax=Sorangium sp. So ce448 TaxID=3133314 RepID=UPI003F603CF8
MTLAERVAAAVNAAPIIDLHTHLFAPQFPALNLWGVDELLTYHYLVAEALRAEPKVTPEAFFALDKKAQADLVWASLFVRRSPLSEATAGAATVLAAFGLDPAAPDLREARAFFAARRVEDHLEDVLRLSGVSALAMTNDPTDPAERAIWDAGATPDPRFYTALRLDRLIHTHDLAPELERWIARMRPRYLAISVNEVSAPPRAVLDACRDHGLPFAMMIGVRRAVNPRLGVAGDGVSTVDLTPLERLAAENPDVRFLVTTLARENTHPLCVVARKFANVLPFGCWWFMNNPSLIEETTMMRLEMLGPTFVPQHSDARVLDQLIYKWRHSRRSIASALTRRYGAMPVQPTDAQIERDARALLGGIAKEWLGA